MSPAGKLAWAILAQRPDGKSEVIKITNHEEADQAVKENPTLWYKSGPFMLVWIHSRTHPRHCVLGNPLHSNETSCDCLHRHASSCWCRYICSSFPQSWRRYWVLQCNALGQRSTCCSWTGAFGLHDGSRRKQSFRLGRALIQPN